LTAPSSAASVCNSQARGCPLHARWRSAASRSITRDPQLVQCNAGESTWNRAVSGAISLSPRSKSSLDWASIHGYPYIIASYWRQGQTWVCARSASSPYQHLTLAGCGGLDFHGPIQYDAAQVDAALAIRCRRGGDGKYDAIRLQAGETDEDQFLRGEGAPGPLDRDRSDRRDSCMSAERSATCRRCGFG
jgi:hypothetical protein